MAAKGSRRVTAGVAAAWLAALATAAAQPATVLLESGAACPRPRQILFLGRQVNSHHRPDLFHNMVRLPFAERDLRFAFTTDLTDLRQQVLESHDALFVYGNAFYLLNSAQEAAMKAYADGGGGIAAMHVACWSLPYSPAWVALVGGGFLGHHAIQPFTPVLAEFDHPILRGLETYTSEDEPYLFKDLANDRLVLSKRIGPVEEAPVTWVRMQGQGRVFYHAGGHDERTWTQANFRELVARGIEWVARTGPGSPLASIDRAWISNGGALAVQATVDAPDGIPKRVVLSGGAAGWHRPVLEEDPLYDSGVGRHLPRSDDPLRVGGTVTAPRLAMVSRIRANDGLEHRGLWSGRGGLVRSTLSEGGTFSWQGQSWRVEEPSAGSEATLVMNDAGTWVAPVRLGRDEPPASVSVLLRGSCGGTPEVILAEGQWLGEGDGTWQVGALGTARLSLNGQGQVAAIVSGVSGKRLLLDSGNGLESLIATGQQMPGIPGPALAVDLREVRLNDAGFLLLVGQVDAGAGPLGAAWLRRPEGGAWEQWVTDGGQPWLAPGETFSISAPGGAAMLDAGGGVWLLGTVEAGGGQHRSLVWRRPGEAARELCREGGPLRLGGDTVLVSSLGQPAEWSCGAAEVAAGKITAVDGQDVTRDWLVRWHGAQAWPVCGTGISWQMGSETIKPAAIRVGGGGTAEDGHGGFLNRGGAWVVALTLDDGGQRLVEGGEITDLDGDHRLDLVEAALGANPAVADSGVALFGILGGGDAGGARCRFLRKQDGSFEYRVEVSGDLRSWRDNVALPAPVSDQSAVPPGFERVEALLDPLPPCFVRIGVVAQ